MRLTFVFVLLLVSLGLAACAGLDAGDFLTVPTPPDVQQERGLPAKLTLNAAAAEYQAWHEDTLRNAATWKTAIDRSDHFRGVFNQFTLGALDSLGPTVAGLPILGPAAPLLAGIAGLCIKRPRDVTPEELRKQKEDSYNAGLEIGRKLAQQASGVAV